jgi:hypothetical protein
MLRKSRNYYGVVRIILTSETPVSIVAAPTKRAGWQVLVTLANPYTADSYPVKNEESTMPDNTITSTHSETPFANVQLTPNDIQPRDWAFLREWANNLGVSLEELLKRILVAAVIGQLYAEKIPEI